LASGERCDSSRIIIDIIVIVIIFIARRRRRRRRMGVAVTSLDARRSGVGRAKVLLGKPSPRRLGRRREERYADDRKVEREEDAEQQQR
tara:strand:- start:818 stop:1084 length:267 start_codon:yes stop_codon:yes gene_type:complete